MTIALPTQPRPFKGTGYDPLTTRLFLGGSVKTGKTTLAAQWAPKTTLFLDLQNGTNLLPGAHYVMPVDDWHTFDEATKLIAAGGHGKKTVIVDTVDLAYKFADAHAGAQQGQVAAGLIEFGKGTAMAEGLFRRAIGRLLGTPDLGVWFVGHMELVEIDKNQKWMPKLDKRVREYVTGEADHVLFCERVGNKSVIRTQPTPQYEAGSRLPLPASIDMDAQALYKAMRQGIKELAGIEPGEPVSDNDVIGPEADES